MVTNLKDLADDVRVQLEESNRAREAALRVSRDVIRLSSVSIKSSHRGQFDEACSVKSEARTKLTQLAELLKNNQEIYYTGYVQDAQKEYTESELTYALIRDLDFPSYTELGVEPAAYLNGMAEAVGECRRHVLDELRKGHLDRVEQLLETMDEVFYVLMAFDYPDAVTQNLRRHTDMVRGVIERTRADITLVRQQTRLEEAIRSATRLLGVDESTGDNS